MLDVTLYCTGKSPHLSMPVTGLLMLQEQGKIRISWEVDPENRRGYPYVQLLGVYAEGKCIMFDMADGYGEVEIRCQRQIVENSDFTFRRSFSPVRTAELPEELQVRMRPFGFHYHVSYPNNFIDKVSSVKEWPDTLFQLVFNGAQRSYFTPDKFEMKARLTDKPRVLFYTRLWDPDEIPALYDSLTILNQNRIRLVSELKKIYGPRFVGGIQFSPLAMKSCRELVASISATKRKNYLQTMKNADICIGTTGLHDSIGWKTAEYIAASKAVINEKFNFEVTGGFSEGDNYLPFTDIEDCLSHVEKLMANPEQVYAMGLANQEYYQSYGRPDKVMENALRQVFSDF